MSTDGAQQVTHYLVGELVATPDIDYGAFVAPAIDVNQLYWPRQESCPAADVKTSEIIDLLDELGRRLDLSTNEYLQEALEASLTLGNLDRRILENTYRGLDRVLNRESLQFTVDRQIGEEYLDGWVDVAVTGGRTMKVRAYPPRLVHIVAGNAPMITAQTDRVGRPHQGRAPPEAAVERSVHGGRHLAHTR